MVPSHPEFKPLYSSAGSDVYKGKVCYEVGRLKSACLLLDGVGHDGGRIKYLRSTKTDARRSKRIDSFRVLL